MALGVCVILLTSPVRVRVHRSKAFTVAAVVLVGILKPVLLAPRGSVTSSSCLGTGCCQKAYGGHSGRVSLGSLSERLGMGRAGS